MSRYVLTGLTFSMLTVAAICLTGCGDAQQVEAPDALVERGPAVELALDFQPGQTTSHEVTVNVTKDFRFEQPAVNKLREEETSTVITTVYDRAIQDVNDGGWATARITLTGLRVRVVKNNEVQVEYDSAAEGAAQNPLNKLIGQSYTVLLGPAGQVKPLNVSVATAGIPGTEGKIAQRLFEAEEVVRRHQILALPPQKADLAVNESWDTIVPSPPGLLSSKSYKKTYTLTDIAKQDGGKLATVKMVAEESAVPAPGGNVSQGMGIFAKMLDNEDEYTGTLLLDLETGNVLSYDETLISTYIASEPNPQATPEQGPDTLRIRFIQKTERKLLNR